MKKSWDEFCLMDEDLIKTGIALEIGKNKRMDN